MSGEKVPEKLEITLKQALDALQGEDRGSMFRMIRYFPGLALTNHEDLLMLLSGDKPAWKVDKLARTLFEKAEVEEAPAKKVDKVKDEKPAKPEKAAAKEEKPAKPEKAKDEKPEKKKGGGDDIDALIAEIGGDDDADPDDTDDDDD